MLLYDNTWDNRFFISKIDSHSNLLTDRTLVRLNLTVENCVIKLTHHEVDAALTDMCF